MKKEFILAGLLAVGFASAQTDKAHLGKVGINIMTPQATMDIRPNDDNRQEIATTNEGILIPKLSKTRVANIKDVLLVEGTLAYVTDDASSPIAAYAGTNAKVAKITEKGYYYYNGTEWVKVAIGANATQYAGSTSIELSGNSFQRAALTGDVTAAANSNATTVARIQGRAVANTAPTNGQVLKWDGTQWAPAADANNSTNIYTEDGTLTSNRTVTMDGKTLTFTGANTTFSANSYMPLIVNSTNAQGGGLAIQPNDGTKRWELSVNGDGNFRLWGSSNKIFVNRTSGNVGIGTDTPAEKLNVAGGIRSTLSSNSGGYLDLENPLKIGDTEGARWRLYNMTDKLAGTTYTPGLHFWNYSYSTTQPNLGSKMLLTDDGNLGIGLGSRGVPSEKLHVAGGARITSLAGTGDRVVLADATGVLKAGTLPATSISGAGNLTGTGITVGNGAGATLKNVTLAIADNAITSAKIADGQVALADLAVNSVDSSKIVDKSIVAADLNQMGAANGQVLKWNGTAWAPAADANTYEDEGITQMVMGNPKQVVDIMAGETFYSVQTQATTRGPLYYRYTGHSITLPPGKWLVFYGYLIAVNPPIQTTSSVWFRALISENKTNTLSGPSGSVAVEGGQKLVSASLLPYQWYQNASGTFVINNTTASSKTYYTKVSIEPQGFPAPAALKTLPFGTFGEEFLYAIKIK